MCIKCRIFLNVLQIFIQWLHWQCCEMDESNISYSSNVVDECFSTAAWCHVIHYESNEYFILTASDMHIWFSNIVFLLFLIAYFNFTNSVRQFCPALFQRPSVVCYCTARPFIVRRRTGCYRTAFRVVLNLTPKGREIVI